MSGDASVVKGPLEGGYHHETYVFPLPDGSREVKCREPREEILWFDRRCFLSEEELLGALRGHVTRVPEVVDVAGIGLQTFIEGWTLNAYCPSGMRVPKPLFGQIASLFPELMRITPGQLGVKRRCADRDRPENGDSDGFLERLITFMEIQVYERNSEDFEELFHALGVGADAFNRLRKCVLGLKERPFCLLHADLHRENFIVDPHGRLWTIDWELAMFGDPLYDLATHLYLMRYPADQEVAMVEKWCRSAGEVRRNLSYGWADDLPRILDFKRAQSVFTDVIRVSLSLREDGVLGRQALPAAAEKIEKVLTAAAGPLGIEEVPGRQDITTALVRALPSS
ncbi:phosphotransferase [Streptomyces anandii]|uniref:Phosphotransferase n=1 Tax=Streptomyces anandii TaxID=285454 RepID=A0ABW6H613_9ACTN